MSPGTMMVPPASITMASCADPVRESDADGLDRAAAQQEVAPDHSLRPHRDDRGIRQQDAQVWIALPIDDPVSLGELRAQAHGPSLHRNVPTTG